MIPQKLTGIDYRFILRDDEGNFIDAYKWAETNVVIILDLGVEKIRIFGKGLQEFSIIASEPLAEDKYGNKWLKYTCVDKSETKCIIRMVSYKKAFKDDFGKLYAASMYVEYLDEINQYRLTTD